ncbi:glycosyltransferase family 39 protein [Desulfotomaculum nigrificans]|uniref:glycosyltransferase family 39 protein n=1 Tax=Desulfotomaculum nigrificans TaxID=1565 RepID=UPI0001FADF51|nr:glycosyltransferase family 39 protein [Desulfotomaculum nigrificans]
MGSKQGQRFDIILICIALLAAFLNIFNIWKNQYANAYYTSAVTSMLQNWHNFFYASFDPAGYVTVDKPPVAFWVQTIFAKIFGVHGWSVILPQALAGVGSVLLMYVLVKPTFGKTAARLASLIMACTPIAVAVSRTNNIDSLLVFTLLLATWMLFRGTRNQKLSWILGAFAMIGVGFNMKMLQAYMVVPAFYLFYLLAFKGRWKRKLAVLGVSAVILVGVSLSWAVVVDSIPKENRPYIGSSQTNSVLELALGYNGISRLTGMNRGGPGGPPNQRQMDQDGNNMPSPQQMQQDGNNMREGFGPDGNGRKGPMPGGGGPPGRGGGGMFGTGQAGPLRLFQTELSGQASWLLPFVAFACVGLLAGIRRKNQLTDKENETLFWLAWLLPAMAFFSVAGFFHHYYLIMLAPPIAALAGAGWVELWNQYRNQEDWQMWLLPSGLLATTAFELYVLQPFQKQIGMGWSIGIGTAGIGLSLVLFLAAKKQKLFSTAAMAGMLVLLVAPLYWAATPLLYGDNSMLPQAGPSQPGGPGQPGGPNQQYQQDRPNQPDVSNQQGFGQRQDMGRGPDSGINAKLLAYVTKNNTGETYLFATTDSHGAAPYIIETGKAVMAMGGFSGSDPILTVEKIKKLVANKEVKYFLIPSSGSGRGGGSNSAVLEWIRANSTEVPKEEWQGNTTQGGPMGMRNDETLYKINDITK